MLVVFRTQSERNQLGKNSKVKLLDNLTLVLLKASSYISILGPPFTGILLPALVGRHSEEEQIRITRRESINYQIIISIVTTLLIVIAYFSGNYIGSALVATLFLFSFYQLVVISMWIFNNRWGHRHIHVWYHAFVK